MSFDNIVNPTKLISDRRFEVQRTNNFEFHVAGIYGSNDLTLAVDSFPLPTIGTEPIELHLGNGSVKVAGTKITFEGGDLVLKDFIGADTEKIVLLWQSKVVNLRTKKFGHASDYKRNAKVYEYSPDGEIVRTWVLEGVWPSSINFGEMNYETGDKKQVTATLSYDSAYREDIDGDDPGYVS